MTISDPPSPSANPPPGGRLLEAVQPSTPQELADVLRIAADEGRSVAPIGGGGAVALGQPATVRSIELSTLRLGEIVDYQPTDMTLSVQAGTTLARVRAILAEHGQMLPVEAPHPERATIGGLLATALTGPRRYGGGTLRDVIIGISAAYPDGTIGKAGGLVVKNVSGFDMMRIHYGALGTLGVIVSANFKVLPIPRAEFTILHPLSGLDAVPALLPALRSPSLRPVALVVDNVGDHRRLAARFEGRESGLKAVAMELSGFLDLAGRLDGQASADFWQAFMDGRAFRSPDEVRIQIKSLPTESIRAAETAIRLIMESGGAVARAEIEPGTGYTTLAWEHRGAPSAQMIAAIRLAAPDTTVTVHTAPDDVKSDAGVWGHDPESIDLMRRLKHEFDPNRVLNPGRFAGMI